VDAVVFNKKSGQIITGLKREQFQIYENGVRMDISNFATPEAPITVTLVLEYSKWTEQFGRAGGGIFEPGVYETVRPVASFLSRFIKPPDDYASVIAFDMRPTPITDFTNDPGRINETINLLLRNQPAFRENNLFDAIKFSLVGGRGDSVVLEDTKERYQQYGGMVSVQSKRRAIILVASGIDTFSKTNYDEVRKVIQESGIPIYIISTGNLFYKRYEHLLEECNEHFRQGIRRNAFRDDLLERNIGISSVDQRPAPQPVQPWLRTCSETRPGQEIQARGQG
jgi:Ca-activated chloride channel family protein